MPGLRTRRLPLAAAIVVVGIGAAFAGLQFYGSAASQAAAASGNPLIARQVEWPRQPARSSSVDAAPARGPRRGRSPPGVTSPLGAGPGATNLAVARLGGDPTVGSTEIDVSNAFVSLGLLGGLTFLGILLLGFTAVVRRYLAGEALALPVLALLVVCLGQWLDGRPLCPDAVALVLLGWASGPPRRATRDVNILIVNHTAIMSGAEATTLELLRERQRDVRYLWASPAGPLADAARALGAEHIPLRGTDGKPAADPRDTPIAVAELGQMGLVAAPRHGTSPRAPRARGVDARGDRGRHLPPSRRAAVRRLPARRRPSGPCRPAIRALVDPAAGRLIGCSDHILAGLRREGYRTPGEVLFEPVDVEAFASAGSGSTPPRSARSWRRVRDR